jgi:hypothetical protein
MAGELVAPGREWSLVQARVAEERSTERDAVRVQGSVVRRVRLWRVSALELGEDAIATLRAGLS